MVGCQKVSCSFHAQTGMSCELQDVTEQKRYAYVVCRRKRSYSAYPLGIYYTYIFCILLANISQRMKSMQNHLCAYITRT